MTVVEVDPVRALEAHLDGFDVENIDRAASDGELFITATGQKNVVPYGAISKMKEGAILANAGHFDVEIDVKTLMSKAKGTKAVRPNVDEVTLPSGKRVYLIAKGRIANLVAAEGHPPEGDADVVREPDDGGDQNPQRTRQDGEEGVRRPGGAGGRSRSGGPEVHGGLHRRRHQGTEGLREELEKSDPIFILKGTRSQSAVAKKSKGRVLVLCALPLHGCSRTKRFMLNGSLFESQSRIHFPCYAISNSLIRSFKFAVIFCFKIAPMAGD